MTRAKISEYSATAGDNTDVNGVNIAEGCPPSSMNNMGREIMAALKRFQVGSDGDSLLVGGQLTVTGTTTTSPAIVAAGDTNTGIFFPAADTIAFTEGGAEAMRIDSDGDVGIGTSAPAVKLDVQGASTLDTDIEYARLKGGGTTQPCLRIGGNNTTSSTTRYAFLNSQTVNGAAQPLVFQTGATERMRITSSGNVGIGTSTPNAELEVSSSAGGIILVTDSDAVRQNGISCTASDNLTVFADNLNEGADSYINFQVDATERMRITSDGYLRMASGTGGIQFGGDTAAANALDDYEEGTWTPTITSSSGSFTSITYDAARQGRYTKIGNTVYIQGTMRTDAITVGTASGGVRISGLPFTSATTLYGAVCIGYAADFAGDMPSGGLFEINNTFIFLYYRSTSNGATVALDVTDLGTGTNANYVIFESFYTVA